MKSKRHRNILTKVWLCTMFAVCVINAPSFHELNAFALTEKPVYIQNGSMMFFKSPFEYFNNFKGDIMGRMFEGREFIGESSLQLTPSSGKIIDPIVTIGNEPDKGNKQNAPYECEKVLLNRCYKDIHNEFMIGSGWAAWIFAIFSLFSRNITLDYAE